MSSKDNSSKKRNSAGGTQRSNASSAKNNKRPETQNKSEKGNKSESTREPKQSPSKRLIHQILPYIFAVCALFLLLCMLPIDMGAVGYLTSSLMFGLFGYSAFAVPILLVYIAIAWRKSIDNEQTSYKIAFSAISLTLLSSLVQVCILNGGADCSWNPLRLWKLGLTGKSSGILGGYVGQLSYVGLKFWGSLIVIIALLSIILMFLVGLTPDNIVLYFKYRARLREEKKEENARREGDPVFIDKPVFTPRDIAKQEEEPAVSVSKGKRKRSFDVDIDPDTETDATPEELGLEFMDNPSDMKTDPAEKTTPLDEALAEIEDTSSERKKDSGIEGGKPVDLKIGGNELDDGLDALFGKEISEKNPTGPISGESLPKKASSDDDFLTVSTEKITDIKPEKPTYGEQLRAEIFPPIALLAEDKNNKSENHTAELRSTAEKLQETLLSFNVKTKIVGFSRGPTVTRYELQPEAGTRVRSIANLVDDIALNLAATGGVRIEAPIPGKSAVGIEVPNKAPSTVYLRTILESPKFAESKSKVTACLGADVAGNPIIFDIAKMPHLLIAGATGMGKSVCINCLIISLLYKSQPKDVRLLLIDPKTVEFKIYRDIPHLIAPIVTEPKKAAGALIKMVEEMERRFALIEEVGVRDLKSYNEITANDPEREHLPQIVIIIDELADLMMTTPDDVENSICRLAQKARAAGMHIIIGTQRPSVDVITGLIKANVPSRIACTVASQVDSRTIIDIAGAEKLMGRGDMLYAPVGAAKPLRVQGAFVSDSEVESVCDFIKTNTGKAEYDSNIVDGIEEAAARLDSPKKGASSASDMGGGGDDGGDPMLRPAIELAIECGKISTSLIQRRLSLGYGRAAKLIDKMEQLGYVSAQDGQKPREVLITKQMYMEMVVNDSIQ